MGAAVTGSATATTLIIYGFEVWCYNRDPDHDPAEHAHRGGSHKREPAGRVVSRDVAERAWETLSAEQALRQ